MLRHLCHCTYSPQLTKLFIQLPICNWRGTPRSATRPRTIARARIIASYLPRHTHTHTDTGIPESKGISDFCTHKLTDDNNNTKKLIQNNQFPHKTLKGEVYKMIAYIRLQRNEFVCALFDICLYSLSPYCIGV